MGIASRALANRLWSTCSNSTWRFSTAGTSGAVSSTSTLVCSSCCSKEPSASSMQAFRFTGSDSPLSGRDESSRSRTQRDMRSTWLMMSSIFFCASGPATSSASSALERMAASGLRRLWATAEDISPSTT
ncbi:hypothetical protein D9M70_526680 [compost metagenome]